MFFLFEEKQNAQQSSSTQTPVVRERIGTEIVQKTLLVSPCTTLIKTTVNPESTRPVSMEFICFPHFALVMFSKLLCKITIIVYFVMKSRYA